jgi:DNA-binding NarL/FixJ family response regulator
LKPLKNQDSQSSNPQARDLLRVVLADDHALVRAGIRALLERIQGVEVLAEAGDGLHALELIRDLQPNIVLLDIAMPGLSGLKVLRKVTANFPKIRVIILTVHETEEYAVHALRSGAAGFLPKSAASAELELALKTVARGELYLSPEISKRSVKDQLQSTDAKPAVAELTPRQREVLTMIANGQSTKDIALTLDISAKTVETHRAQLMERLQIHDVAGLVRFAIKTGLVKIDE